MSRCLSLALVLSSLGLGCSTEVSDDSSVSSEVRTRSCPTSFSVHIASTRATDIASEASVGGSSFALSARDRAALEAIQRTFVSVGSFEVKAELTSAQDGVCRYHQASMPFPNESVKLYSKGGKDILEMNVDLDGQKFTNQFRVYAFPKTYKPEGFTFADDSEVLLDGVVGIADGPNLVVKVGTANVAL